MISGINHITLSVRDIERSFDFYAEVLGLKPLVRWNQGAYFLAGATWLALTLDEDTREQPLPEYTHLAFTVSETDFQAMCQRVLASGAEVWQPNSSEGASLYFTDPNGHKLELHASDLETRLRTAKDHPWEGAIFFV
ncbi:fosfomycin resistance glutathione transferase [bacterium]|nr:fosfomycin resistance glutathione transferase [bacterium]